jgi:hypothetical protein
MCLEGLRKIEKSEVFRMIFELGTPAPKYKSQNSLLKAEKIIRQSMSPVLSTRPCAS